MLFNATLTPSDYGFGPSSIASRTRQRRINAALNLFWSAVFAALVLPPVWSFLSALRGLVERNGASVLVETPSLGLLCLVGVVLTFVALRFVIGEARQFFIDVRLSNADDPIFDMLRRDHALGAHTYAFLDTHLRITGPTDTAEIDWSLVTGCRDGGHAVHIALGDHLRIFVPKAAVAANGGIEALSQRIAHCRSTAKNRPRRHAHLVPQALIVVSGRVAPRHVLNRQEWQFLKQSNAGFGTLMRLYWHPLVFVICAATCGLNGWLGLQDFVVETATGGFDGADLDLGKVLSLLFALLLVWGTATGALRQARRLFNRPFGAKIGPEGYLWGETTFRFSETGLAITTATTDRRFEWQAFSGMEEFRDQYILRNSVAKTVVVPKALFPDVDTRRRFEALVEKQLLKPQRP